MAPNNDEGQQEDLELPFFDLATIVKATDDFSINKKLGQGGFGAVYRVIMQHASLGIYNSSCYLYLFCI